MGKHKNDTKSEAKGTNWNYKGNKSEPKGDPNASTNRSKKKKKRGFRAAKIGHPGVSPSLFGTTWLIWGPFVASGRPPTPLYAGSLGAATF